MAYVEFDPFADAPDGSGVESWMEQQGWSEFLGVGSDASDLRFRSFRRAVDGGWEYAVDVWDVNQGSPFVKVDSFVELMDLMARWAPAIEAASVVGLLDRMQSYGLDTDGAVETIAAKAAYGATTGLAVVEKDMRAQAAKRRQIQEQRRAQ